MPTRLLREGILTSDRVNALKPVAEVFYRRLMSVVDDWGRFSADPRILRVHCFPLKIDEVREADIARSLAEVQGAGLIALYAVDGKPYLELLDFRQKFRAKKSKYPPPPTADAQQVQDAGAARAPRVSSPGEADAQHVHSRCTADAQHRHSACTAPVHLDGDGDGDGDGDENTPRELTLSTPGGGGEGSGQRGRKRKPTVAQSPPSVEAWRAYAATLSPPMPATEADRAYDHYTTVGWVVGKAKTAMKDWESAVRNCHRNWQERVGSTLKQPGSTSRLPSVWERKQRLEAIEAEIRDLESRSPGPHCQLADFLSRDQLDRLVALRQDRQQLRRELAGQGPEGGHDTPSRNLFGHQRDAGSAE